jgi:hypothetical protein
MSLHGSRIIQSGAVVGHPPLPPKSITGKESARLIISWVGRSRIAFFRGTSDCGSLGTVCYFIHPGLRTEQKEEESST